MKPKKAINDFQREVLVYLRDNGPVTARALTDTLVGCTMSSMQAKLTTMYSHHWVNRGMGQRYITAVVWAVTPEGLAALEPPAEAPTPSRVQAPSPQPANLPPRPPAVPPRRPENGASWWGANGPSVSASKPTVPAVAVPPPPPTAVDVHTHRFLLPSRPNENGAYVGRCACGEVKAHWPFTAGGRLTQRPGRAVGK